MSMKYGKRKYVWEREKDKRMRMVLKMQLQTEYNQRKSDLCVRESEWKRIRQIKCFFITVAYQYLEYKAYTLSFFCLTVLYNDSPTNREHSQDFGYHSGSLCSLKVLKKCSTLIHIVYTSFIELGMFRMFRDHSKVTFCTTGLQ